MHETGTLHENNKPWINQAIRAQGNVKCFLITIDQNQRYQRQENQQFLEHFADQTILMITTDSFCSQISIFWNKLKAPRMLKTCWITSWYFFTSTQHDALSETEREIQQSLKRANAERKRSGGNEKMLKKYSRCIRWWRWLSRWAWELTLIWGSSASVERALTDSFCSGNPPN